MADASESTELPDAASDAADDSAGDSRDTSVADPVAAAPRLFSFAVALATFSTIAVELMLTRIFSVTMYYHFAFMVISLALLGLAIAGVTVYLLPGVFRRERAAWQAGAFMLGFAVTSALAVWVALGNPIDLTHWNKNIGGLLAVYFASALPFLLSGFCVTLAISWARQHIGLVYACDLVGAALGCVLVIPVVSWLGAPGAILLMAAVGALSAVMFFITHHRASSAARRAAATTATRGRSALHGVLAVSGALVIALVVGAVTEPASKRLGEARNPGKFLGERQVLFERWNAFSQITVAPAGADDHRWIFIDADAATRIWSGEIAASGYQAPRRIPEVRVASLAYAIRARGPALVVGPGGGTDIISALSHGVPRVIGVEVNPVIVEDVMGDVFAEFSGNLYRDPRVDVVVDEGRSHVRRSDERYSTIQATLVDTWAASSSGAFTLSENNIYTAEAFGEFLDHLQPDGILTVTRWYDRNNPQEFLRLVVLARVALEQLGVTPAEARAHIFLATDRERRGTILVSRAPLSSDDIATLTEKCRSGRLLVLYSPLPLEGPLAGAGAAHSRHEDALLASYLRAPDSDEFLAALPYNAAAPTDDRPFFFYNLRPSALLAMLGEMGGVERNNLGVLILLLVLLLSLVLTAVFVVLPLVALRRDALVERRGEKLRVLLYFLCLGLGFILVEIGIMQRFVLFLGHPIYSLAVVLATILFASGVGSALSGPACERFGVRRFAMIAGAVLIAILAVYAVVLGPLFQALLGLTLPARIAIAAALVMIPGLFMGCMLPSGIRTANALGSAVVPWGWGLNGATSVVGSILAIFISMNAGFTAALLVGMAVYVVALVALPASAAGSPPSSQ